MTTIPIPAAVPDLPPLPIGALAACALDLLQETGDLPQPRYIGIYGASRFSACSSTRRPAASTPSPGGQHGSAPSWSARPWRTSTARGRCAAPTSTTTAWASTSTRLSA